MSHVIIKRCNEMYLCMSLFLVWLVFWNTFGFFKGWIQWRTFLVSFQNKKSKNLKSRLHVFVVKMMNTELIYYLLKKTVSFKSVLQMFRSMWIVKTLCKIKLCSFLSSLNTSTCYLNVMGSTLMSKEEMIIDLESL